ncbi:acyl carrier protein [Candidatus Pacearchaeota archaeon]|nr:acyl carrier protein [Candidatus Pacearchaeota archaeon]
MEKSYIENKVKEIAAESLTIIFDEVTLNSRLVDDLGADSLELIDMLMNVEDEFDIEISDDVAESVVTISDLIDIVRDKYESITDKN